MKRLPIVAAAAVLLLTACGDQPVPEHGRVTDAKFTPAWTQWVPGTCAGNPPICTAGYPIFWPDEWRLEITDLKNKDWFGTVAVDRLGYERCNLQELWPECSRENYGDIRTGQ